ncbi:MAG: response regulator [Gammaproteobacteria bacterium]
MVERTRPRLLIADDESTNRAIYVELFEDRYELDLVSDGDACLAQLAARTPDLLLLDVAMPGTDGIEICRRVRADPATAGLPVVLVSGYAADADRARGLAAGASSYIAKPFDLGAFEDLVAGLLAARAG